MPSFSEIYSSCMFHIQLACFLDIHLSSVFCGVQKSVSSLIDSKLEKHKNLREESRFYWKEISDGTFKFDRKESEVCVFIFRTSETMFSYRLYCSYPYLMTGLSTEEADPARANRFL